MFRSHDIPHALEASSLGSNSALPDTLQRMLLLLEKLKSSLQEQVIISTPPATDRVIAKAAFLLKKKLKHEAQERRPASAGCGSSGRVQQLGSPS